MTDTTITYLCWRCANSYPWPPPTCRSLNNHQTINKMSLSQLPPQKDKPQLQNKSYDYSASSLTMFYFRHFPRDSSTYQSIYVDCPILSTIFFTRIHITNFDSSQILNLGTTYFLIFLHIKRKLCSAKWG